MNSIAMIFAHKQSDEWSNPLAIVREFESLGWKVDIHTVYDEQEVYFDTNVYQLLDKKYDIIFHMDWGRFQSPAIAELKNTGAFCVLESGDDPQQFHRNGLKAPHFDLVLSPDIRCVEEYRKQGINAEWWTHFADTRMYRPLNADAEYWAVCSRGTGKNCRLIDEIAAEYPDHVINKSGWHGSAHNEFLNKGMMVIQQSQYGEITRRVFEGMACKKLIITDRLDESTKIQELFVENEEIVFYDNKKDFIEKILYYVNNDQERLRIAENGYRKVLSNHTQVQRTQFLIDQWKKFRF